MAKRALLRGMEAIGAGMNADTLLFKRKAPTSVIDENFILIIIAFVYLCSTLSLTLVCVYVSRCVKN